MRKKEVTTTESFESIFGGSMMKKATCLSLILFVCVVICGCGKLGISRPFVPSTESESISIVLTSQYYSGWTLVSDASSLDGLYRIIQMRTKNSDESGIRGQFMVKDRAHGYGFDRMPGYAQRVSCLLASDGDIRIILHKKEL